MLLGFFSIVIMCLVAYAYLREGLFTALTMFCNVFLAGVVAFNFWEPLADSLEPLLRSSFLNGFEDFLCLIVPFCVTLGALRLIVNSLCNSRVQFSGPVQSAGGIAFGVLTGYLVSGFFLCSLQTLPWHERFMDFDPEYKTGPEHALRHILPPDRVWLFLMHRSSAYTFANNEEKAGAASPFERYTTFDKYGTFELRYARFRRFNDDGTRMPYNGEFDEELRLPRK
jgi:hypothetical protein